MGVKSRARDVAVISAAVRRAELTPNDAGPWPYSLVLPTHLVTPEIKTPARLSVASSSSLWNGWHHANYRLDRPDP